MKLMIKIIAHDGTQTRDSPHVMNSALTLSPTKPRAHLSQATYGLNIDYISLNKPVNEVLM